MKKLGMLLIAVALTLGAFVFAASGAAAKSCTQDPTQDKCQPAPTTVVPTTTTTTTTESPGANCSHGVNDDGTCRPDPNENGQDCDAHGNDNPAGNDGNEDHCLTATTTSVSSPPPTSTETETTTTTTATETTPPPTETETTTTATEPPSTSTEPPVVTTTTTTTAVTPSETTTTVTTAPSTDTTTVTKSPPGQSTNSQPPTTGGGEKEPEQSLAFTGVEDVVPIAGVALAFLTAGSGLMWAGSRKRRA